MYMGIDNKKVLSIEDMMRIYEFSVNDFVHSDLFEQWIPIFIKNVDAALNNQVQQLIDNTIDPANKKEL